MNELICSNVTWLGWLISVPCKFVIELSWDVGFFAMSLGFEELAPNKACPEFHDRVIWFYHRRLLAKTPWLQIVQFSLNRMASGLKLWRRHRRERIRDAIFVSISMVCLPAINGAIPNASTTCTCLSGWILIWYCSIHLKSCDMSDAI